MHDESMNREPSSSLMADLLDQRLIHALESAPVPQIPADFAARIAAGLPARTPISIRATHYGRAAMLIGILLLLVVMLALARTADHSVFKLGLDWTLFAMFLSLTVWFSTDRRSTN